MANVKVMDRKDAAQYLGVGSFHVGELIRKGKFPGAAKQAIEGRKTQKWWIPVEELDAYKATRQSGVGKRADGRTKYTIYLNPNELEAFEAYRDNPDNAEDALIPAFNTLVRANPPKSA